uniref:Uncharacterized protein n=1 Tax=viral metagenome TaxID=1070528 RepID=A0A6C0DR41_9ZZZZ
MISALFAFYDRTPEYDFTFHKLLSRQYENGRTIVLKYLDKPIQELQQDIEQDIMERRQEEERQKTIARLNMSKKRKRINGGSKRSRAYKTKRTMKLNKQMRFRLKN